MLLVLKSKVRILRYSKYRLRERNNYLRTMVILLIKLYSFNNKYGDGLFQKLI